MRDAIERRLAGIEDAVARMSHQDPRRHRMGDLLAQPVHELTDQECVDVVRHLNRRLPGAQHSAPIDPAEERAIVEAWRSLTMEPAP